jgi:hypothetical protein
VVEKRHRPSIAWPAWANLVLGAWLVVSTLLLASRPWGALGWNAFGVAALLMAFALVAGVTFMIWPSILNVLLGIWLLAAPFVLEPRSVSEAGFSGWNHLVVGVLVVVLALLSLGAKKRAVPDILYDDRGIKPEQFEDPR